jgi:hypothetical protein
MQSDQKKQLITLTVIAFSGFNCKFKRPAVKQKNSNYFASLNIRRGREVSVRLIFLIGLHRWTPMRME